jgi:GNAT superfamily N-acetyltransferase
MHSVPLYADGALARRLERTDALNLADYARSLSRREPDSGACVLEVAGGLACFARKELPINRASGLGFQGPVTPAELQRVEDFYRGQGVAPAVELCPLAHASLRELLGERGYRVRRFLQVNFRPLGPEPEETPPPPPGLEVLQAGPEHVETWVRLVATGFSAAEDAPPDPIELTLARLASEREGVRLYLARLDGEAVGAAGLSTREGIATLFAASTRHSFRGRGVQTALIRARLRDAVTLGCGLALVHTSPGEVSQANEARAGFRVGYTRVLMGLER